MMKLVASLVLLALVSDVFAGIEQCPGNVRNSRNLRIFGTYCYEFVLNHPVDWKHANSDCKLKGGALVDIHSREENMFIYKTLRELGYFNDEGVWIGLTDVEKENNWHWSRLGSPLNYKNWAPNQPGILGQFEDCVVLQVKDGQWHDFPCSGFLFSSERHGWVCKYDAGYPAVNSMSPIAGSTFYYKLTTRPVDNMSVAPDNGMTSEQPMSAMPNGGMATDGMMSMKPNFQMMTSDSNMNQGQGQAMTTEVSIMETERYVSPQN